MQFTFKIGEKIKEAWPMYKLHFGTFILFIVASGIAQIIGSRKNFILSSLSSILSLIIFYVLTRFILSLVDKKDYNPLSINSLPTLGQFWNLLKTALLTSLSILGGFILLIIPGFYIAGRLMFSMYLSVEKNQGARVTIKEAWKMTEGYGWLLFWKSFVIALFSGIGFLAFIVGGFVTYPIGMVVLVMMYREFAKMKSETPVNPVIVETIK
jgi:membrane-anchored glycerophosphoryl diester phosphodiesterase (GDPDase)